MGKDERVKKALLTNDSEALSRMGKKGSLHREIIRDWEKDQKEGKLKEALLEQARVYSVSPDGDVLPPDPEIVKSLSR